MQAATNIGQQTIIGQNAMIIRLLQQQPRTIGGAVSRSASAGVRAGYYSAQG